MTIKEQCIDSEMDIFDSFLIFKDKQDFIENIVDLISEKVVNKDVANDIADEVYDIFEEEKR